jgi:hypothetical protein
LPKRPSIGDLNGRKLIRLCGVLSGHECDFLEIDSNVLDILVKAINDEITILPI